MICEAKSKSDLGCPPLPVQVKRSGGQQEGGHEVVLSVRRVSQVRVDSTGKNTVYSTIKASSTTECSKSRWTLKGKIKGSPPFSRRTLLRAPCTIRLAHQSKESWNQAFVLVFLSGHITWLLETKISCLEAFHAERQGGLLYKGEIQGEISKMFKSAFWQPKH